MSENLLLQTSRGKNGLFVFYGSINGSKFVKVPVKVFTSQRAYRSWCFKTAGHIPERRSPAEYDLFIRQQMARAVEVA